MIHRRWVVDGEKFEVANGETVVVGGDDLAERKRKLLEVTHPPTSTPPNPHPRAHLPKWQSATPLPCALPRTMTLALFPRAPTR